MNKIINDNLKVGDKFKGQINNEIFEIISINHTNGYLKVECKDRNFEIPIKHFKRLLLKKI